MIISSGVILHFDPVILPFALVVYGVGILLIGIAGKIVVLPFQEDKRGDKHSGTTDRSHNRAYPVYMENKQWLTGLTVSY
jgi:hypothetical protein